MEKTLSSTSAHQPLTEYWKSQEELFGHGFNYRQVTRSWDDAGQRNAHRFTFRSSSGAALFNEDGPVADIFIRLLSACGVLLSRYSEESNIVISTPFFQENKHGSEVPFVVPVCIAVQEGLSVHNYLTTVVNAIKASYLYQDFWKGHTVERGSGHRFASNILFCDDRIHAPIVAPRHYELVIRVSYVDSDVVVSIYYDGRYFEGYFIEKLETALLLVLQAFTSSTAVLREIDIIGEDDKNLLRGFRATQRIEGWENATLQQLVESQVVLNPEAIAVVYGNQRYTYAQINKRANQLAWRLKHQHNVQQHEVVGVITGLLPELIIAILGVVKSGAVYLPIDARYPAGRKRFLVQDACVRLVLVDDGNLEACKGIDVLVMVIDKEEVSAVPDDNPVVANTGSSPVYTIYTSGSTGNPKGVVVENSALINLCLWHRQAFSVTPGSRATLYASIAFDASAWEIWPYLISGATLYPIPEELRSDLTGLILFLRGNAITHSFLPTAICEEIIAQHEDDLSTVILTGGDSLRRVLPSSLKIVNNYGPTEGTVVATSVVLNLQTESVTIPIGKPISNTMLFILDRHLRLKPTGVAGDIYIAGAGLARGYLNAPELTASKFIDITIEGERVRAYDTGDRGMMLPDGNVVFLGRDDDQVKVRGYRIELGEIERALLKHPSIKNVAVVIRKDSSNETSIVAYYATRQACSQAEVKAYVAEILPAYMVPEKFVHLPEIPISVHGKVDKKSLPAVDDLFTAKDAAVSGFQTQTESRVYAVWRELLKRDDFGADTDLFEIGANSLRVIQAISRLHKQTGVKVGLRNIFENPTVSGIAAEIERSRPSLYAEVLPLPVQDFYEVSHAQKRLWILDQFQSGEAYNMPGAYRIEGDLNIEILNKVFATLISRHEILRTNFISVQGQPRQRIVSPEKISFTIAYKDLRHFEDSLCAALEVIREESALVFDLSNDVLFRASILHLSDRVNILFFNIHHIISDGWSVNVLIYEIVTLYEAYSKGVSNPLRPLRVQYKEYAAYQNRFMHHDSFKDTQAYWWNLFKDTVPVLQLRTDFPRPKIKTFRGASYSIRIGAEIADKLNLLSRKSNGSLFITLLASVKALLYRYTMQEDIVIGSPVAGREHPDFENQLGFYVNTLPIRTKFKGDQSFEQLLHCVRDAVYGALEHQLYPFDQLVDDLDLGRDMSRNPLFDINLVLQNASFQDIGNQKKIEGISDLTIRRMNVDFNTSKFDLLWDFREQSGEIILDLEYNTDLFKPDTIISFCNHYKNLLQSICDDSHRTVNRLEMLSSVELRTVLEQFNATEATFPHTATIPDLFERQVLQSPTATVLRHRGKSMSYEALNKRANQLAHFIASLSLPGGSVVGILVENSFELMVGILGVLKAGCTYMPLNPTYPRERLQFMISNAAARIILSETKFLGLAGRLQWECKAHHCIYLDIPDPHICVEAHGDLMRQDLWDYVGETGETRISRGGWVSSYTGHDFSDGEMAEYAANSLAKLKPFLKPSSRVLEIGCASGLTMFAVAPFVGMYYGTDLSEKILKHTRDEVTERGITNIRLKRLAAHEIDQLDEGGFDVVILNSVVQSFGGYNYLRHVIGKVLALCSDKAVVFVGDVQDLDLKAAMISDLEEFATAHAHLNYRTKTTWNEELFLPRQFFDDLACYYPAIEKVEHTKKQGTLVNELTLYRYDTTLTIDKGSRHRNPGVPLIEQIGLEILEKMPDTNPRLTIDPAHILYIIYTSGTTGIPKGVMVRSNAFVNLLNWYVKALNIRPDDRNLLIAPITFDLAQKNLFAPLITGGQLVFTDDQFLDYVGMSELIAREKITLINCAPSAFYPLLDVNEGAGYKPILSLRCVILGGEPIKMDRLKPWQEQIQYRCDVLNSYGPTECTDVVSSYMAVREDYERNSGVPIGKPVDNVQLYVLDKFLNPLPVGVPGYIHITGICVGKGYLNQPELEAKKFAIDPFHTTGGRMYATGDLGFWTESGDIVFYGRDDDQIKINGFRVELGEIERILLTYPGIKETAVLLRAMSEQDETSSILVAYLVSVKEINPENIREYLSKKMPEYMVPNYFIRIDGMPVNSNGKLDRKALPDVSAVKPGDYVEADTAIQKLVLRAWQAVLRKDLISATDNFFLIGGDSIKAIQIASWLYKEGYRVELRDIFQNPRIVDLSNHVRLIERMADQRLVAGSLPLTPIQKNFFSTYMIDRHHYNQSVMLQSVDRIDVAILTEVFGNIQKHHDMLRVTFRKSVSGYEQYINGINHPLELREVDLRDNGAPTAMMTAIDDLQSSFDLESGPLMKVCLFRLAEEDRIFIVIHHLVVDGISWRILIEDVMNLYGHYLAGQKYSLPVKTDSYKTWSEGLHQYANSAKCLREIPYWQSLEKESVFSFNPKDLSIINAFKDTTSISASLTKADTTILLTGTNHAYNTEINDLLLAAFVMSMRKCYQSDKILIDLEGHGREAIIADIDVSRTVGWFTSVVPVVLESSADDNLPLFIKRTKETIRRIPEKGIGYGILKYLTTDEQRSRMNFCLNPEIRFNYLGQFDVTVTNGGGLSVCRDYSGNAQSARSLRDYLLDIYAIAEDGILTIGIDYNALYGDATQMRSLLDEYVQALITIIRHCEQVKTSELTPADFGFKDLTLEELDSFFE